MAQRDLLDAFNDCIERLANGQPLDAVLRAYPQYAEQLAPMLRAAEATRAAVALPPQEVAAARERVRARLLDALAEAPPYVEPKPLLVPMFRRALTAAAVLLIVGFLGVLLFNREAPPAIIESLTPATETQLATSEASATLTATATESPSPTATLSPTFTGTVSMTPSPTATDSATATETATATATETGTASTTPSTTSPLTPTASATRTPTASLAPSETLHPSATACVKLQPLNWVTYRVRSGDTLSELALATGSTVSALMRVNCLSSASFLVTGTALLLPRQPAPVTVITPAATSDFVPPQVGPTATDDDDDDDGDDDNDNDGDDDDSTDEPDDDPDDDDNDNS